MTRASIAKPARVPARSTRRAHARLRVRIAIPTATGTKTPKRVVMMFPYGIVRPASPASPMKPDAYTQRRRGIATSATSVETTVIEMLRARSARER